jgi:predicted glycosyl hydrolase (DUF1957 family)
VESVSAPATRLGVSDPASGRQTSCSLSPVSYAEARVRAHLARHEALADQLEAGQVDEAALAAVEAQDNLLPDIDFEDFA